MRQGENPRHCVFGVDIAFAVVFGGFLSFPDQRKLLVASSFQRADQNPALTPTLPFVAQELAKATSPCKTNCLWRGHVARLLLHHASCPPMTAKWVGLSVRSDASIA